MKISKHLHSCLLIQEQDKTLLIDPGIFTFNEKALDLTSINKLDYLLFTHEHSDHLHLPFVKEILAKFPEVTIITNPAIVALLEKESIKASAVEDAVVKLENSPHEKLWDKIPPEHVVLHLFNTFTHPGDSLHFEQTGDILALPLTAPWGSTTEAVSKALSMKPKVIIPIHDWLWKDDVRRGMYERLTEFFKQHNIAFKGVETGEIIEVET